ncbi:hypothetical protein IMG5_072670, partial [Ichthyophthirius multifiliis]
NLNKVPIPLTNNDLILLNELFEQIQQQYNLPIKQAQNIQIYDPVVNKYLEITQIRSINLQNFKEVNVLYFSIGNTNQEQQRPREKRVKERQIQYVKEKVDEWRKLYQNGYTNQKGENLKLNLDLAASMVGLSRKTLDDYFSQIKKAEKLGFDFQLHKEEKMGMLRKYVKQFNYNIKSSSNNTQDVQEKFQIKEEADEEEEDEQESFQNYLVKEEDYLVKDDYQQNGFQFD